MITKQDIENALAKELICKEYKSYNIDMEVLTVIRNLLTVNNISTAEIWTNMDRQRVTITYKRQVIGYIDVKKAKGAHHYKYGESWNDWTYKGFEVHLYADSIEQAMTGVEDNIVKAQIAADTKQAEAVDIVKLIMEKTGKTSIYDVASICDYINKNTYTLRSLI